MFGLSFEKLILVAVIAAFLVGPQRLPVYASKLTALVRTVRDLLEATRRSAELELGLPLRTSQLQAGLRQYDPRRIVAEAFDETERTPPSASEPTTPQSLSKSPAGDGAARPPEDEPPTSPTGRTWVVTGGSSGHPRRQLRPLSAVSESPEGRPVPAQPSSGEDD